MIKAAPTQVQAQGELIRVHFAMPSPQPRNWRGSLADCLPEIEGGCWYALFGGRLMSASGIHFPVPECEIEFWCLCLAAKSDPITLYEVVINWPDSGADLVLAFAVWDAESDGGYYVFYPSQLLPAWMHNRIVEKPTSVWWKPWTWDYGWPEWERDLCFATAAELLMLADEDDSPSVTEPS